MKKPPRRPPSLNCFIFALIAVLVMGPDRGTAAAVLFGILLAIAKHLSARPEIKDEQNRIFSAIVRGLFFGNAAGRAVLYFGSNTPQLR